MQLRHPRSWAPRGVGTAATARARPASSSALSRTGPQRSAALGSTAGRGDRTNDVVSELASTSAVPWLVAEAVLLELTRLRPTTVHLVRDAGHRITRHLQAAEPDDEPWTLIDGVPPGRTS